MATPKIITASRAGLTFRNVFGPLGPPRHVTVHHTAGPKDRDYSHALTLVRQYHRDHTNKGWGGIGYHYCITRTGTIICLRPISLKGAHVGGHNTNNVGVMFHGTTGDRPTAAQINSFRWLLSNAHTTKMPKAHRATRPLNKPYTQRYGHNDWSGHTSNACPGTFKPILRFRSR